jgi:uncharacterized protein (TIGR02246 family)
MANKPANSANNTASTNTASTASADADVKKVMTDLAGALAKNDSESAAKFYADDYHLVTPDGVVQTKAERLADMKSGVTKFDTFSYNDVSVRTYGDTAVAIATVKATGMVAGKPRTNDMRATLVLRKMADGWKVVSGQATPIAAAAAPPSANKETGNTNMASSANAKKAANSNK